MEVQQFYRMCKSEGLKSLDEVGKALEQRKFDSGLVNDVVENSKGELAAVLAPTIMAGYWEDLTERSKEILNLYAVKAGRSRKCMETVQKFKETCSENNFILTIPRIVKTKKGPQLIFIQVYGNGPILAQMEEDKRSLDEIHEELRRT